MLLWYCCVPSLLFTTTSFFFFFPLPSFRSDFDKSDTFLVTEPSDYFFFKIFLTVFFLFCFFLPSLGSDFEKSDTFLANEPSDLSRDTCILQMMLITDVDQWFLKQNYRLGHPENYLFIYNLEKYFLDKSIQKNIYFNFGKESTDVDCGIFFTCADDIAYRCWLLIAVFC